VALRLPGEPVWTVFGCKSGRCTAVLFAKREPSVHSCFPVPSAYWLGWLDTKQVGFHGSSFPETRYKCQWGTCIVQIYWEITQEILRLDALEEQLVILLSTMQLILIVSPVVVFFVHGAMRMRSLFLQALEWTIFFSCSSSRSSSLTLWRQRR